MSDNDRFDLSDITIVRQFGGFKDGERFDIFELEILASTEVLAKAKARWWARKEFPFISPFKLEVLDSKRFKERETRQSRLQEFVPDRLTRTRYAIEIGIRDEQ